jgi:predicted lipoprotein with Yx(FWY)xxD motif
VRKYFLILCSAIFGIFLIFFAMHYAMADNILDNSIKPIVNSSYTVNIYKNSKLGNYLVGSNNMTLYYLSGETENNLKCTSKICLTKWPILAANELNLPDTLNSSDFSIFTRPDGQKQVSYNGHPLYFFSEDKLPGYTLGDNFVTPVGTWKIIHIN